VRKRGGGRQRIGESDPELIAALQRLVAEDCRGDPVQVLLWTSKGVRRLAAELREQGHDVHFTTVAALLRSLGYSLQSNRKTLEEAQHPDRDAQFRLINEREGAAIAAGEPAISRTAQLAVVSIRAWWQDLGSERYPAARTLQVTADCGGSDGK